MIQKGRYRLLTFLTFRHILLTLSLALLPIMSSANDYVSNTNCLSCHQKQFRQWKQSDHYHSMLPATKENVLGNFNQAHFMQGNNRVKFFTKNNHYFISITDKDGKVNNYPVKYTFGYKPLQQYLIALPKGKLQAFTIAWDTQHKRWFDLQAGEHITATSPLHWSKRFYNWNYACADCHSTNFQKNFDGKIYKSTFSGVNVNCQACHGPGRKHILWAKRKKRKIKKEKEIQNKGFSVNFKSISSEKMTEACAQCHSRRVQISKRFDHHKAFMDMYIPATLRHELYYPNGQIKDEVFVYGSFVQSKMYHAGVKCINCHNPHSLKLTYSGNAVCTQCHRKHPPKPYTELVTHKNYIP